MIILAWIGLVVWIVLGVLFAYTIYRVLTDPNPYDY